MCVTFKGYGLKKLNFPNQKISHTFLIEFTKELLYIFPLARWYGIELSVGASMVM